MLSNVNPLAPIVVSSGFLITVNPGVVLISGVPVTVPSTVISLTASATNYIYVNTSGVVVVNTTGFPSTNAFPIATVVCSSTSTTSITDSRSDFLMPPTSGASANTIFQSWGGFVAASSSVGALSAANKIQVSGFYLAAQTILTNIITLVVVSDAGNSYDWGIYDSTGSLKAHVGAHAVGATDITDLPIVGGSVTLSSGKYYFAFTGAANTATLARAAGNSIMFSVTFLANAELATASSGGSLPTSVVLPADSWTRSTAVHGFTLYS